MILGCSGKDGTKDDLIGIGSALWRAGFSVLLFDCRDRGESDRARRTLGFIEQLDAAAAISYAKNRMPDARLGMLGFSMGAVLAILVIHGEKDTLIPLSSAKQIYAHAGEPKYFWQVLGADHCGAYFADRKTYMEKVTAFFQDHLGR